MVQISVYHVSKAKSKTIHSLEPRRAHYLRLYIQSDADRNALQTKAIE